MIVPYQSARPSRSRAPRALYDPAPLSDRDARAALAELGDAKCAASDISAEEGRAARKRKAEREAAEKEEAEQAAAAAAELEAATPRALPFPLPPRDRPQQPYSARRRKTGDTLERKPCWKPSRQKLRHGGV